MDRHRGRHHPVHPLVVLGAGRLLRQTTVVADASANRRRPDQQLVIETPTESHPPAAPVEADAGHQNQIQLLRVHHRRVGGWLELPNRSDGL
jgi:hypothetical protein